MTSQLTVVPTHTRVHTKKKTGPNGNKNEGYPPENHHAHQQLVDSQRLVGDRLGELTAELRTLQSQSFPPDAKSGDRVTALAARQRTFQAGAAVPAPDDEVAAVALETGKSV